MKKIILMLIPNFITKLFSISKTSIILKSFLFAFIVIFSSCDDDPVELGGNILPDSDNLDIKRDTTLMIEAFIEKVEPYHSQNYSKASVGIINHPYFGKFEARFGSHILPDASWTSFGSMAYCDSIVVHLNVDKTFGEDPLKRNIIAHYMSQNLLLLEDSIFTDNTTQYHSGSIASDLNHDTRYIKDSVILLRLKNEIGDDKLLDAVGEEMKDDSAFTEYFKGLYFKTEDISSNGFINTVNLSRDSSWVTLYYSNKYTDSLKIHHAIDTSLQFKYYFQGGMNYSEYEYDYSSATGSMSASEMLENDEAESDPLLYLQGFDGIKVRFNFENLEDWLEGNTYAINKAEIVLNVFDYPELIYFTPPELIDLVWEDSLGNQYKSRDYTYYSGNIGVYDDSKKEYRFNISMLLQEHIQKDIDVKDFYLLINNYRFNPNGVILEGGDKIKLEVFYSIID